MARRGQRPGRAQATGAVSRRRFLAGSVALAGAGFLVACSSGNNKKSSAPTAAAPVQNATSAPGGASATSAAATSAPASTAAAANVPKGGTLTQTIIATDAKSFHPYQTTDTASSKYQGYIYGASLTKYDPKTLDHVADGAVKWDVSSDKKTYTFTLKDIKWSDGQPLTTDDFVWTYQQALKPENKFPYRENLTKIATYTPVDAKTLAITLNEPLAVGLEQVDVITPLPRHVWEKYDWNDPVKNPEIQSPTVFSGMWKLKEWKKDDHATFVANDTYYDGRPNIDSMTVRVFGTPALAYQALKAGEVDYSTFQPADYADAKKQSSLNVPEWYPANGTWGYVGYNLRHPALKDVNVRKAIAYACDRNGMIQAALFGLAKPQYANYPQESWVYNPNVEHYDFSPDKAKQFFAQAGYTPNAQKKLAKDGQALNFKLIYPTSSKPREQIATILQQQLNDLGVGVDVQGLEFQAYISAIQTEPGDWDLQLGAWSSTIEPHFNYQLWAESSIPQLNAGAYVNKDVENLFDQGSKEFDREKRKQIYQQIQKILTDDEPYAFLYEALNYAGVNKKVGGVTATPLGIEYNMNQWYITK
jgi:peptide/nickel transport system substrate-binding protein